MRIIKVMSAMLIVLAVFAAGIPAAFAADAAGTDDPGEWRLTGHIPWEMAEDEELNETADENAETFTSPFRDYIYTKDSRHANYTVIHGVDVSSYQNDIDWNAARNAGVDYAFIRVGFRGYGASGSLNADTYYDRNIRGAIAAGVKVGVYIYSQATTVGEAEDEAQFVLDRIKDYNITMPVVLDFEFASTSSGNVGRLYNAYFGSEPTLDRESGTELCLAFNRRVRAAGYTPMVYANKNMLTEYLDAKTIAKDCGIWLAQYGTVTTFDGDFEHWQYTSVGKVDGITGSVDCDFWFVWIEALDIDLPSSDLRVNAENDLKINATLTPYNASNPINWRSSDTSIATVSSDGVVTGILPGTVTITASVGSFSDSCTVTVLPPNVKSVSISGLPSSVRKGQSFTLSADITPSSAASTWHVSWESSNADVATVDSNGKVNILDNGIAVITATAGTKNASVTLNVGTSTSPMSTVIVLDGVPNHARAKVSMTMKSLSGSNEFITSGECSMYNVILDGTADKGTYILTITQPGFLSYTDNSFDVPGSALPSTITLFGGDSNGDGYVNVRDYAITSGNISDHRYADSCDFDLDSDVDSDDASIIIKNYGKTGTVID